MDGDTIRKGERTRGRMIKTCSQLMRRRGYAATALSDVVAESAAPRGSMYFHFPDGKEQLAEESVRRSVDAVTSAIETTFEAASGPGGAMEGVARLLASNLERSAFRDGCPVGTVTLEMAAESELIRAACAAGFERWQLQIAAHLRDWGVAANRADDLALLIVSAFEGALMVARARRDTTPLQLIAGQLAAAIHSSDGEASRGAGASDSGP